MKKSKGEGATLAGRIMSEEPVNKSPERGETDHPTCPPPVDSATAKTLDPWTRWIMGLPMSADSPMFDEQLYAWLRYVYDATTGADDED